MSLRECNNPLMDSLSELKNTVNCIEMQYKHCDCKNSITRDCDFTVEREDT